MHAEIKITIDNGHVHVEAPLADQQGKDLTLMMLGKAIEAIAVHQVGSLIVPALNLPTLESKRT